MLPHPRSVNLLFTATDLPVWSGYETTATLYQRDREQFHLLLTEPVGCDRPLLATHESSVQVSTIVTPRLLWLELSPCRATLTTQGNGQFSYRHLWQWGIYGQSRYWINGDADHLSQQFCLQNFTRSFTLKGNPFPTAFRVEYELWSGNLQLGHYVLNLEIHE
jgi:hypothetical protein